MVSILGCMVHGFEGTGYLVSEVLGYGVYSFSLPAYFSYTTYLTHSYTVVLCGANCKLIYFQTRYVSYITHADAFVPWKTTVTEDTVPNYMNGRPTNRYGQCCLSYPKLGSSWKIFLTVEIFEARHSTNHYGDSRRDR